MLVLCLLACFLLKPKYITISSFDIINYNRFKIHSFNKGERIFSSVMPSSSSKSKGKRGRHHTKSSHGSHHTSSRRQDEPGESSRQAHQDDTGAGREFGQRWRAKYQPRSDESSVDRGRHRRQQHEYEGYVVPPPSPTRPHHRQSMWGDAARASMELVQTQDRQARARNDWRQGREAARGRGERVAEGGCCVIL